MGTSVSPHSLLALTPSFLFADSWSVSENCEWIEYKQIDVPTSVASVAATSLISLFVLHIFSPRSHLRRDILEGSEVSMKV